MKMVTQVSYCLLVCLLIFIIKLKNDGQRKGVRHLDQNKGRQPSEEGEKDQESDTPVYHDLDINQGQDEEKKDQPTSDQK